MTTYTILEPFEAKSTHGIYPPLGIQSYFEKNSIDSWHMLHKMFDYICNHDLETYSPLGTVINSIIGAGPGYFETQSLVFAVAAESIVKQTHVVLEDDSKINQESLEELTKLVEEWPGDAPLTRRVLGFLKNIGPQKVKDMFYQLKDRGIISESQIQAWKKLRNPLAHGDSQRNKEPDHMYRLRRHVVEMIYLMIFHIIGYRGYYSPWGSDRVEPVYFDGVKHQPESQDVPNNIQSKNDKL